MLLRLSNRLIRWNLVLYRTKYLFSIPDYTEGFFFSEELFIGTSTYVRTYVCMYVHSLYSWNVFCCLQRLSLLCSLQVKGNFTIMPLVTVVQNNFLHSTLTYKSLTAADVKQRKKKKKEEEGIPWKLFGHKIIRKTYTMITIL